MFARFSGVLAQTDTMMQYGAQDIAWRRDMTIDYAASPALIGLYGRGQERMNWPNPFGVDEIGHTAALAIAADGSLIIADINNACSKLTSLDMHDGS